MLRMKLFKKKKNGYSLLEVIVAITILSFALVIMMRFLVFTLQITSKSLARSIVRDEISTASNLIERDIRNAKSITSCTSSTCNLTDDTGNNISWQLNSQTGVITKSVIVTQNGGGTSTYNSYTSSDSVKFTLLDFSPGFINNGNTNQIQNIIVTIVASHVNSTYGINNITNQISVSTRNLNVIQ